jgi:hypothetical protein
VKRFRSKPKVRSQPAHAILSLRKAERLAFRRLDRPLLVGAAASAERLPKWVMGAGDAHADRPQMWAEKRPSIGCDQ